MGAAVKNYRTPRTQADGEWRGGYPESNPRDAEDSLTAKLLGVALALVIAGYIVANVLAELGAL